MSTTSVEHEPERQRFVLRGDDGAVRSFAEYRRDGDTWVFHHTVTEPPWRGHGLAAEVVQAAMDEVRAEGGHVVPTCWYVDGFLRDHPEYAELRLSGG